MLRQGLLAIWTLFAATASPAFASDEILQALADRGFVPWASDYVGEPELKPGPEQIILGAGFLIRLPVKVQARHFLVAKGAQVVVADRIDEVGPLGLSTAVADALGLNSNTAITGQPITLQIIALQRRAVAKAESILTPAVAPIPKVRVEAAPKPAPILPADVGFGPTPSGNYQLPELPVLPKLAYPPPVNNRAESEPSRVFSLGLALLDAISDSEEAGPNEDLVTVDAAVETTEVVPPDDTIADALQELPLVASVAPNGSPIPLPRLIQTASPPRVLRVGGRSLFLQAGLFQNEANARRLATGLRARGIPIDIRSEAVNGVAHWRVLAGPFPSPTAGQAAKDRGGALLSEAYPIWL